VTNDNDTTSGTALVAIDIAKVKNDIVIELPGKQRRRRMKVLNTRAEHQRFIDQLRALNCPVQIGFEATGNYHRPLAWRLLEAGFDLRLISSVALARTREALHNGWDKNDPKDAQVMLHMLRIGATQRYYDPLMHGINDWQELSKTHEIVSKAKTEAMHRLQTHYLPLYFPEIDRFRHSSRAEWFFIFLDRFPVPAAILELSREQFIEAAWPVIGRKVAKARILGDIYETARTSIGLPVAADSPAVVMYRLVIAHIRQLIRQRDEIERQAHTLLADHPDYQRLMQLPGVGPIIALTVLAEAGDLRRFRHHRQFLKFCGFDLATRQSGQFRGRSKLSKHGNARLRRVFWMAGQVAVRQRENSFRDKYRRYIARDPDDRDLNRKALTAVAAKMARIAHAVVTSETDYRPFYGVR
jgi:transposase